MTYENNDRDVSSRPYEQVSRTTNWDKKVSYDRKQLSKIKIVIPNVAYSNDDVDISVRKRTQRGICTLEEVLKLTEQGKKDSGVSFNSQEFETPAMKELKKIQVILARTLSILSNPSSLRYNSISLFKVYSSITMILD